MTATGTTAPSASSLISWKRVGSLELFFDLVFVFAVTQLVGELHDDHSLAGWGGRHSFSGCSGGRDRNTPGPETLSI